MSSQPTQGSATSAQLRPGSPVTTTDAPDANTVTAVVTPPATAQTVQTSATPTSPTSPNVPTSAQPTAPATSPSLAATAPLTKHISETPPTDQLQLDDSQQTIHVTPSTTDAPEAQPTVDVHIIAETHHTAEPESHCPTQPPSTVDAHPDIPNSHDAIAAQHSPMDSQTVAMEPQPDVAPHTQIDSHAVAEPGQTAPSQTVASAPSVITEAPIDPNVMTDHSPSCEPQTVDPHGVVDPQAPSIMNAEAAATQASAAMLTSTVPTEHNHEPSAGFTQPSAHHEKPSEHEEELDRRNIPLPLVPTSIPGSVITSTISPAGVQTSTGASSTQLGSITLSAVHVKPELGTDPNNFPRRTASVSTALPAAQVAQALPNHALTHAQASHFASSQGVTNTLVTVTGHPHPQLSGAHGLPIEPPIAKKNVSLTSPATKKSGLVAPFVCEYPGCGKTFGKKFNLKAHKRVHTGDQPFHCSFPTCNKRFKWKSSLTFHEGLHLNAPDEPPIPVTSTSELASAAAAAAAAAPINVTTQPKKSGKV